jgi:methionine synthase II (cobalamin-independent)
VTITTRTPVREPEPRSDTAPSTESKLPRLLPTSVVGSYSVPEWLERLETDFYQRRISRQYLDDIYECDASVRHPLPIDDESATLGSIDDLYFTRQYTDRPVKFSLTGPFSLARRIHNQAYTDPAQLVLAPARILNREVKRWRARKLQAMSEGTAQIRAEVLGNGVPEPDFPVHGGHQP